MAELQQSVLYRRYIDSLGWNTESLDGNIIFYKRFPLIGGLAKIQRSRKLPDPGKLAKALQRASIRTVAIEPSDTVDGKMLGRLNGYLRSRGYRINGSPYLPTKTLIIPTVSPEDEMFAGLSEAKRRGVRRARKYGLYVKESGDIELLIRIKQKSAGLFGFITTYGLTNLWKAFYPGNATVLAAYTPINEPVGAVLLLFHNRTCYYWIAGAGKSGKRMFAPTLLVWESLKVSHARGMKNFDFVGVWDERLPRENREWLGFTRFKEGFGGLPKYYPIAR